MTSIVANHLDMRICVTFAGINEATVTTITFTVNTLPSEAGSSQSMTVIA